MSDVVVAGAFFLLLGGLLLWTARHAVTPTTDHRRSPGLRTPSTLRSPAAWLAAHRRIAPHLHLLGSLSTAVGGLWLVAAARGLRPGSESFVVLPLALFLPLVLLVVVIGNRAASDAADDEED